MESYGILVFFLATLGLGVLVAELFIPSAGMLTIVSVMCFAGSTFCAWKAWFETGDLFAWWSYVGGMIVLLPSVIAGTLYVLPRTSLGQTMFAAPQELDELTPYQEEEQRLLALVESEGTAMGLLSPGGMVQIDREKFHAESEGVIVESGTSIVVVGVRGNRLLVRPTSLHQAAVHSTASATSADAEIAPEPDQRDTASSNDASIDFDMPETA